MKTNENRIGVKTGFRDDDMCFYAISAPDSGYNFDQREIDGEYFINVTISYESAYVYLNNGTNLTMAADELTLGFATGTDFTYEAFNNTIYPIFVAQGDEPLGKINIILWKKFHAKYINKYYSGNWTNIYSSNLDKLSGIQNEIGQQIYTDFIRNMTEF